MSPSQRTFLIKRTLTSVFSNGFFSAVEVLLVFRHRQMVPLSGSPSLIAGTILQTVLAAFMSTLPPSVITAKWMTTGKTPVVRLLIRAVGTALAAGLASSAILPVAMPRVVAASLPFRDLLQMKCLYGMAIGLAATPCAVAAVLRGSSRGEATEEWI